MSSPGAEFGRHAAGYDSFATVQREAAEHLAELIREQELPPCPRLLDLGAGTGLLSLEILSRLPGAECQVADISGEMLALACSQIPGASSFQADFDQPDFLGERRYHLIASSFALQWSRSPGDLAGYLCRCLLPGGLLALALPVRGTLAELREDLAAAGGSFINEFPDPALLLGSLPGDLQVASSLREHRVVFPGCREALRSITRIGAAARIPADTRIQADSRNSTGGIHTVRAGECSAGSDAGSRLTPGILRQLTEVISRRNGPAGGSACTLVYRVLYLLARRQP